MEEQSPLVVISDEKIEVNAAPAQTGSFCSRWGILQDLKARAPYYVSDWTDAWDAKVLASILYMFFTSIGPAITFGNLMDDKTAKQIGVVEVLMSTAVSGSLFSIFAGQGLVIVGVTGPVSIFTLTVYKICGQVDGLNFLPFYAWTCIWAAVLHWILALTNACTLVKWVTRFSCEVFGFLIAVIYIVLAVTDVVNYFKDETMVAALVSLVITFGLFGLTWALASFPKRVIFTEKIRTVIADYSAAVSIVIFTALSYAFDVAIPRVSVPDKFQTTSGRNWLVDLTDLPTWGIFAALGPGLILTILFFFDHNVSSLLSQKPEFNLKKPSAYHLDFFVLGITIFVCGIFGMPPTNGLIPQAPLHVMSLATVEFFTEQGKTMQRYVKVVEQRVSNLGQAALIGVCLVPALLEVVGMIPRSVLSGLFLYMGIASFDGNQLYERLCLFLTEKKHVHGPPQFIDEVAFGQIVRFTIIQFSCFLVIYCVTLTDAEICFPVFIALLVPLRRYGLPKIFSENELRLLDSEGEKAEEEPNGSQPATEEVLSALEKGRGNI